MMQGYMRFVLLKSISESRSGHTGYSIMKDVYERCGKRPSPGSIYPILQELLKEKFVTMRKDGKRKTYTITPAGKKCLSSFLERKNQLIENVQNNFRYAKTMLGVDDPDVLMDLLDRLKSDEAPLREYTHDTLVLRNTLIPLLLDDSLAPEKRRKIRRILRETIKKLRALNK